VFGRASAPVHVAHTRLDLARALSSDKPDVAIAEATAALDAYRRLGADRHADAAASVLRLLGVPTRGGPKGRGSDRARATGARPGGCGSVERRDRGAALSQSKTVEHHVSRVFSKLGVRNRTEAAGHLARSRTESGRA